MGGDGKKIAPTGDIFDYPPGGMISIRGELADHVEDHVVPSPERAVFVAPAGTESSYPRPPQSLNNSPPGSNILFCPHFVSMTLRQEGAAGILFFRKKLLPYETDWVKVLKFVASVRQNQIVGGSTVVSVAVEVSPAWSKPPVGIGERISKGEKHDMGAAAPL